MQAVAVPVTPSSADGAEYRKQLAERYGFRQIGEQLPDIVTLKEVIDTLPKKVKNFMVASCIQLVQIICPEFGPKYNFCHFGPTAE